MTEPCREVVANPSGLATPIPDRSALQSEDSNSRTRLAIAIDSASHDDTVQVEQNNFPGVRLVTLEKNRGAVARNLVVGLVNQPYIAFCDDDAWWAYGSLSQAIKFLEEYPCLGWIMSKILVEPDGRYDPCCRLMEESHLPNRLNLPGSPILGFIACGVILRRGAFCSAGGFNQEFGTCGHIG